MEDCCDEKNTDCCSGKEGEYCPISKMLFKFATDAWNDLMIEKMKKVYESNNGAKMDKVAAVAVEHCSNVWEARMKSEDMKKEPTTEEIEEYKKKIMEAFMQ